MYCPECGKQVNQNLNYCNSCGAKLTVGDDEDKDPESLLKNLILAVALVAVSGLGILIGLSAVLLFNNFPFEYLFFVIVAYLLALSGICFMLLRLISKLVNARFEEKPETGQATESYQPPQLAKPRMTALNEPLDAPASVTEHTTRTLDEVLVERK
ncbi:MAG: zinc ribbon domain-containing protein [Pyrinomonadaceae bacterium]